MSKIIFKLKVVVSLIQTSIVTQYIFMSNEHITRLEFGYYKKLMQCGQSLNINPFTLGTSLCVRKEYLNEILRVK